jgi:AraC-like DNA-binding protein
MTPRVGVTPVASADESLPAKPTILSGRETMAPRQAGVLQAYIASHLHSTIRVMDLVRAVHSTPNRFFRLFKKRFGWTPHQYVMRARIARAQRLLLMSEYTLEQIAVECGFGNRSHLANLFRDATGQPPGQWRRIHATQSSSPIVQVRPIRPGSTRMVGRSPVSPSRYAAAQSSTPTPATNLSKIIIKTSSY